MRKELQRKSVRDLYIETDSDFVGGDAGLEVGRFRQRAI